MNVTQTFWQRLYGWNLEIEISRTPNMNGFFRRAVRHFAWEDNGYDPARPPEDWSDYVSDVDRAALVAIADKLWDSYWTAWEVGGGSREELPARFRKE